MTKLTRRDFLMSTAGIAAATSMGGKAFAASGELNYKPEEGAKLRVLRWKRFVQGDEDLWNANTKKFTEKTGVEVRIDAEGWEDVRPKAAVAANIGSGPDIIIGWFDDPHQYPDKLMDLSELANYLDKKYGGWYDVCKKYGMRGDKWIALPLGVVGNALCYRESQVKAAGFDSVPKDTAGFLKLCQALKAKGTPVGFALGQDPSNNKAFLDNQISMTANGISVYYAAKNSTDPKWQAMAKDIQHAHLPIGPIGKPTELMQITQMMLFKYSKYPNAAKAYLQFMMEADQYNPWMEAAIGYVSQSLKAYEANPIWTVDPKHTVYRDAAALMLDNGHAGPLGTASAAVMADYVVLDMIAAAASGSKTPKEAAAQAAERAKRYYKT